MFPVSHLRLRCSSVLLLINPNFRQFQSLSKDRRTLRRNSISHPRRCSGLMQSWRLPQRPTSDATRRYLHRITTPLTLSTDLLATCWPWIQFLTEILQVSCLCGWCSFLRHLAASQSHRDVERRSSVRNQNWHWCHRDNYFGEGQTRHGNHGGCGKLPTGCVLPLMAFRSSPSAPPSPILA
jgi:hypothetical protein